MNHRLWHQDYKNGPSSTCCQINLDASITLTQNSVSIIPGHHQTPPFVHFKINKNQSPSIAVVQGENKLT